MKYLILMGFFLSSMFASESLLQSALQYGLKPVPKKFEVLKAHLNESNLTKEKIQLGKRLFFDKALSLNKDISCASCHSFKKGGVDQKSTAIGHKNQKNPFHLNTPTVLNTAFSKQLFWDGRSSSLQDQAKGPLQAPFEMSITPEQAQQRIAEQKGYKEAFLKSYGSEKISFERIVDAISAYEKTLLTRGRFDEFLEGDMMALNAYEKEGLDLFIRKSCVGCHTGVALGGQNLRKFPLVHHSIWSMKKIGEVKTLLKAYEDFLKEQNSYKEYFKMAFNSNESREAYLVKRLGKQNLKELQEGFFHELSAQKAQEVISSRACNHCHDRKNNQVDEKRFVKTIFPFENVGGFVGKKDSLKFFRVPLLRNVVRTYPYFHNGKVEKLEDAVKIMIKHQHRTQVDDEEIKKIVAFLKTVDGELVQY